MGIQQYDEVTIGVGATDLHDSIQIALANVPVDEKNIEASYLGSPRVGRARLKPFTTLLNEVSKYRSNSILQPTSISNKSLLMSILKKSITNYFNSNIFC